MLGLESCYRNSTEIVDATISVRNNQRLVSLIKSYSFLAISPKIFFLNDSIRNFLFVGIFSSVLKGCEIVPAKVPIIFYAEL